MRSAAVAAVLVASLPSTVSSSTGASGRGAQIRTFANRWLGTPYQWGGASRAGIDCSAYLRTLYRDLFNVELPRTTAQQIGLGIDLPIDTTNPSDGLEPGDLLFYVDRTGTPNHVVVYMGAGSITHSVSGRGVVVEPIRKIFGRRVIARRFLVPSEGGDGFAPIPPAGPIVIIEVPCPASYVASKNEVRTYAKQLVGDLKAFGERDICDFRALAEALRAKGGEAALDNARKLDEHAIWLESIDALKGTIGRGW
jgi:hypothetical protein